MQELDDKELIFRTGRATIGNREMVVKLLSSGLFCIEAEGVGAPLAISDERFTTKREAQIRLDRYASDNAKDLEKRDFKNAGKKKDD